MPPDPTQTDRTSQTKAVPTLDDVAKAAGVSTATVSRCLNMPNKVSQAARDRVLGAVERLGYTPNFSARAMAAKRTQTIGAIIPTMENSIFARGLQAFQETLHARGYTLLVASSAYQPDIEAEQIRTLVGRSADGLLLIGYDRPEETYAFLQQRGVPTLMAWAYREGDLMPSVGFDNRAAMVAMTETVVAHGHRDVAVISGVVDGNDRAAERLQGILSTLASHGIDPLQVPVVEVPYTIESGASALQQIMANDMRPTAIICGNDVLAAGAMRTAQQMGLDVPHDVSITGFDDMELACLVTPNLTTVHVPHRQMGITAAEQLIDMIENGGPGTSTRLESEIRVRGSLRDLRDQAVR